MKVIIAGSRTIYDYELIKSVIVSAPYTITEVVSGGARGVDYLGMLYATENKLPIKQFIPKWDEHGRAAGIVRNGEMADYADAAVITVKDYSRGSMNMMHQMNKRNKLFFTIFLKDDAKPTIIMDTLTEKSYYDNTPISRLFESDSKDSDGLFRFFESSD